MDTNERLIRAVELATRKLASTGPIDSLLHDVLAICVDAVGASGGTIYIHDDRNKRLVFRHVLPEEVREKLPFQDIADDFGVAGRVFQSRKIEITEFPEAREDAASQIESATGVTVRTMITVPLTMEAEEPVGVVQLLNKIDGPFTDTDAAVLDTVAAVSTMAILNWRLTDEATRASTLLGMGKVSHDIGNLAASLFANISFSEMAMGQLNERLAGAGKEDAVGELLEPLRDSLDELKHSVDRIVGYSRLVSDLSAGKELRPDRKPASLAKTILTSAAYLESEGRKSSVAIRYDVDENAPATLHDELYVFRIVQNLVGNAIKAVRETADEGAAPPSGSEDIGEVHVRYRFEAGAHVVEVCDSGPGMSQAVIDSILAGNARSEWAKGTGSGWGTRIVKELAASHGATLEIESKLGSGSTFRVVFPHVPAEPGTSEEAGTAARA